MRSPAELALGIIFVVVSLPFLIYLAIVAPYVASLGGIEFFLIILLIVGIALIGHSEGSQSKPKASHEPNSVILASSLSALEKRILTLLSERKTPADIGNTTGVSPSIIDDKIAHLYSDGYITDGRQLTEKGYETVGIELPKAVSNSVSAPETSAVVEPTLPKKEVHGISLLWVVPIVFGIFAWLSYYALGSNPSRSSFYWVSFVFFVLTVLMIIIAAVREAIRRRP